MTDKPMTNHKQICADLAPAGYHYGGFWDGHYHFQTGDYKQGFSLMSCLKEDLTPANLAYMAEHGLTRILGFNYD